MRRTEHNPTAKTFNEPEWLQMLISLARSHRWQSEAEMQLLLKLPIRGIHLLMEKGYRLRVTAIGHIVTEYYKTNTEPATAKFQIPIVQLIRIIKNAASITPVPIKKTGNLQRVVMATTKIGVDKLGEPTRQITIITSTGGEIITAYPGVSL